MKVIILAAGKSTRLHPLTIDKPKSLLELEPNLTLLDLQLNNLKKCCIRDVVLVTGYLSEKIEEKLQSYKDMNIKVIYNPFYDISNNLMSLWTAINEFDDDIIITNGDNVYHHEIIKGLMKNKSKDIVVTITKKDRYDEDDMKVITENGKVKKISKNINPETANSESVGIIKFTGNSVQKLKDTIHKQVRDHDNRNVFWLTAIQNIINSGHEVGYHEIEQERWGEIDFPHDFEKVKKKIKNYK